MERITDTILKTRVHGTGIKLVYAYGGVKLVYKGENLTSYGTRREAMNVIEAIEKYVKLDTEGNEE